MDIGLDFGVFNNRLTGSFDWFSRTTKDMIGMETTVKLRLGDEIITSVIFGSVDFPVDTEVALAFHGTDMLLYDTQSGALLADGSL